MEIITSFDKILDTNNRFYVFNCTKADTLFLSVKGTDKEAIGIVATIPNVSKITELLDTNYVALPAVEQSTYTLTYPEDVQTPIALSQGNYMINISGYGSVAVILVSANKTMEIIGKVGC